MKCIALVALLFVALASAKPTGEDLKGEETAFVYNAAAVAPAAVYPGGYATAFRYGGVAAPYAGYAAGYPSFYSAGALASPYYAGVGAVASPYYSAGAYYAANSGAYIPGYYGAYNGVV